MSKYRKDISQADFERIERFLLGVMDQEELMRFEAECGRDPLLQNEVSLQRKLMASVESGSIPIPIPMEGRQDMDSDSVHLLRQFRWYAAAASVVLILGIWFWGFRQTPEEKLFVTYFVPEAGLMTPMGVTDNFVFNDAMVDYKQEEYHTAIEKWRPLWEQEPANDTLNYFIGVAYLALGRSESSISYLEKTTMIEESVFIREAWYYLGMAHLKMGNRPQAKAALEKSSLERSKAILDQLEE